MHIRRDHPVLDAVRVTHRLWIGSHPPVPGHRCADHPVEHQADLKRLGFDFLALTASEYQPSGHHFPGVVVCYAPFDDDPAGLDGRQVKVALDAATKTVQAHQAGRRCLVTCWAGRNRSGLVTALALARLSGLAPSDAGDVVRDRRGPGSLVNPSFRGLLQRVQLNGGADVKRCALCEAAPITRRYHEDALCWIADCKDCQVPMAVYREHGVRPPRKHLAHMVRLLRLCGRPGVGYRLDDSMNTIPDHYHVHLRPA